MIKAVLFDNDGILIDSELVLFEVTRDVMLSAGIVLEISNWARDYLGKGMNPYEMMESWGASPAVAEKIIEDCKQHLMTCLEKGFPLLEGVAETINLLHGQVRLALVTGSSRKTLFQAHGGTNLLDLFECIITRDESPRLKPWPDPYQMALERLGLAPEDAIAVEDSPRGLNSAKSAGLRCVLIPTFLTDMTMCRHADWIEEKITGVLRIVGEENPPGIGGENASGNICNL